jgi:hypothetical protein
MIPAARFSSAPLRRLALRAMTGRIDSRGSLRLQRLLARADDDDRRAYDQVVALFSALEHDGERDVPLVAGQRERVLIEVLSSVEAPARPHLRSHLALRLAPALALLIVTLGLCLAWPHWREAGVPQPRGSAGVFRPGLLGLEVFCMRDRRLVAPPPRVDATTPDARCHIDDELQLMITRTADHPHLLVLGLLDDPGAASVGPRPLWYYPVPPTGESGLAPRGENQPLGQAVRLAVNHRPGRLRIVALFSRSPLRAETLLSWLRTLPPEESGARLVEELAGASGALTAVEQRVVIAGARAHTDTEVR